MSDIDVMARTVYGEARNQSFMGQVAVAYVISNRAFQRNKSITEVCLQPLQFSCWNKNDPNRKIIEFIGLDKTEFQIAYGISCLVVTRQLTNPVDGANHYHTIEAPKGVKWPPSWAKNMIIIKEIGSHRFLKE